MAGAMRGAAGNLADVEGGMVLDHDFLPSCDQAPKLQSSQKAARVDSVFAHCPGVRSPQPAALACQLHASSLVRAVRCAE